MEPGPLAALLSWSNPRPTTAHDAGLGLLIKISCNTVTCQESWSTPFTSPPPQSTPRCPRCGTTSSAMARTSNAEHPLWRVHLELYPKQNDISYVLSLVHTCHNTFTKHILRGVASSTARRQKKNGVFFRQRRSTIETTNSRGLCHNRNNNAQGESIRLSLKRSVSVSYRARYQPTLRITTFLSMLHQHDFFSSTRISRKSWWERRTANGERRTLKKKRALKPPTLA